MQLILCKPMYWRITHDDVFHIMGHFPYIYTSMYISTKNVVLIDDHCAFSEGYARNIEHRKQSPRNWMYFILRYMSYAQICFRLDKLYICVCVWVCILFVYLREHVNYFFSSEKSTVPLLGMWWTPKSNSIKWRSPIRPGWQKTTGCSFW